MLLISAIFAITLAGLICFQKGFLLTRTAIKEIPAEIEQHFKATLWDDQWNDISEAMKKDQENNSIKVVLVLIDALRFDFAARQPDSSLPYHNKLPVIDKLLQEKPYNSHLFHFIADPPTTTMQRLKALMTGSLPTFIDAGSNFATGKVPDDHLLHRLKEKEKRLVFMGDDTWMGLYEEDLFYAAYPYPSFEVFDLHTVDNGCLTHIWDYIEKFDAKNDTKVIDNQWDILVAHFLGVDHVGHRYGPHHFEMEDKLTQLNGFLTDLFESVSNDTVIFVFGDHGMDPKGDHGGDSVLEVDAGLFVYSKRGTFDTKHYSKESIMLPRGNIPTGKELLGDRLLRELDEAGVGFMSWPTFNKTRYPSVSQIDLVPTIAYLLGIDPPIGSLGHHIYTLFHRDTSKLCNRNNICIKDEEVSSLLKLITLSLENIKQIERFVFSYSIMTDELKNVAGKLRTGLSELALSNDYRFVQDMIPCVYEDSNDEKCAKLDKNDFVEKSMRVFVSLTRISKNCLELCRDAWARFNEQLILVGALLLVIVPIYLLLSLNWPYVTKSDVVSMVFIVLHGVIFASNSYVIFEDSVVFYLIQSASLLNGIFRLLSTGYDNGFFAQLLLMALTRFSSSSTICREEQLPRCSPTFHETPPFLPFIEKYDDENSMTSVGMKSLVFLVIATVLFHRVLRPLLRRLGLAKIQRLLYRASISLVLSLLTGLWTSEYIEEQLNHKIRTSESLEFMGYFIENPQSLLSDVVSFKILCGRVSFLTSLLLLIYGFIIKGSSSQKTFHLVIVLFLLTISTQLPPGVWMLLFGLTQYLLIAITSKESVSSLDVLQTSLLGFLMFFSTGHQVNFSSIQFQTGFIGLSGFNFYLSGALVTMNSIGSFLVFNSAAAYLLTQSKRKDEAFRILLLHRHFLLFMSVLFTAIHRRHLMVWNVFAPRFMFAAIETLCFDVLMILFTFYTDRK